MAQTLYEALSKEGKTLLDEALEHLKAGWDPSLSLVRSREDGEERPSVRESLYYALALMIREEDGAWQTIRAIVEAVTALQIDAPEEVFHGVFRHAPSEPLPPAGRLDRRCLSVYSRYWADRTQERIVDAFSRRLQAHPALKDYTGAIESLLIQAAAEEVPIVWRTYEPNLREFVLMCFAMLITHGEARMEPDLVQSIDHSARLAMEGAIARSESRLTPLNTNIQCMHVFLLDYFGRRLSEPGWQAYALAYARDMLNRYRAHHACAEFNSPTYYGVDLSTLGFLRRYSENEPLKALAAELEEGVWRDAAEFYNPAMRNFCGPYSRAYELDMAVHTCFYDMLYWALGEETFPWHPFSTESVINPLMLLGDVLIPEDVKTAFLTPKEDVEVTHCFRELSERGDPDSNDALCTATAWITPDLMAGALRGSENPSHQLHPLVVFWRQKEGLGTIKLLRCLPDGRMQHLHTVLFNGAARKNHLTMDVEARVGRDVDVFFEIECAGLDRAEISDACWHLPGLTVSVACRGPKPQVTRLSDTVLRVVYPARVSDPASMRMSFDLTLFMEPQTCITKRDSSPALRYRCAGEE